MESWKCKGVSFKTANFSYVTFFFYLVGIFKGSMVRLVQNPDDEPDKVVQ